MRGINSSAQAPAIRVVFACVFVENAAGIVGQTGAGKSSYGTRGSLIYTLRFI